MSTVDLTGQLWDQMRRELARRGRGSISAAEQACGWCAGQIRYWRNQGMLRVPDLEAMLEALEVAPTHFFQQALERSWASLDTLPKPLRRIAEQAIEIRALLHRAERSEPEILYAVRFAWFRGHLRHGDSAPLGAALHKLDSLRYQDAEQAFARAVRLVPRVRSEADALRLLAVCGSALRLMHRLSAAHLVLWEGLRMCRDVGRPELEADFVQRLVYVVLDRAEYDHAIRLARYARRIYRKVGTRDREGQTFVDEAVVHIATASSHEAVSCYKKALSLLEISNSRNRAAAYQGLAAAAFHLRQFKTADRSARQALEICPPEPHLQGRLQWLRALIADEDGRYRDAIPHYQRALRALRAFPADSALVGAQYIRLLLKLGRIQAAREEAQSLVWLVVPVEEKHPPIKAALTDLIRAGMDARAAATGFNLRFLDQIVRRIEGGRAETARPNG